MKPGKINSPFRLGASHSKETKEIQPRPTIAVWDDFQKSKKVRTKREYEKGQGKRMVPKQGTLSFRGDENRNKDANLSHTGENVDPAKSEIAADHILEDESLENKDLVTPEVADVEGEAATEKASSEVAHSHSVANFATIEATIGYTFRDRNLIQMALTHRSALVYKDRADYERLEFLGDAVLDLVVAHFLSVMHPEAREGDLSKMRAALVNTQALAGIARGLGISPFIRLGRGEFSSGGHERPSILADVMEAIIGAIYLDSSYETVFRIVEKIFGQALQDVTPSDPKTELQELLHLTGSEPPNYLLELVEGPEHAPTFVTVVSVDGETVGRGRGPTKKAAQQAAAAEALAKINPSISEVPLAPGQKIFIPEAFLSYRLLAVTVSRSD